MSSLMRAARPFGAVLAFLTLAAVTSDVALAQAKSKGKSPKSSARAKATPRAKAKSTDREVPAADRIVLRDGSELLGQVWDSTPSGGVIILARREWLRAHLPDRTRTWEEAERESTAALEDLWRRRLESWRRERPTIPAAGDRITPWLHRELSGAGGPREASPLMSIEIGREDVKSVEKRGEIAARTLRQAWLLNLPDPETPPLATLTDSVAGRGVSPEGDDAGPIDRLLPPSLETEDRWIVRRAATEVLNDEGLRFIRFGNTVLPEPIPGQPPDPSLGAALVEGTVRDFLAGGRADPLPGKLQAVAGRGRVGAMVTRIEIAPDLNSASAESTFYYRSPDGWERAAWRQASLRVGETPPMVVDVVARDPQIRSMMNLVDSIGGGFVTPELKQQGLMIGATAGGAAVMARVATSRALVDLGLNLDFPKPNSRSSTQP